MIPDEVLANKAREGVEEAFDELVKRYRAMVYYVALQTISNHHEAEDITHDVFISASYAIGPFSPDKASFKTIS